MRIMGLDFGSKTVGVAVSDSLLITAQVERWDAPGVSIEGGAGSGVDGMA